MAKIMLVEDDRSLQEIYSIRLVAEGYEIARADDGEEALAKAVQEKPDLIIADVMMPKISGFDMLDILRSQPETQNIKVIMMTALSSDDQRQRGESLGAERYLVKSQVGIEDVINTVHEVLGDKPNDNAKANIETLSNIPDAKPEASATPSMEGVQTTPTTTIQPTNPAAGPAPTPGNMAGGVPTNFNQAPVAMPGAVPTAQYVATPAAGAVPIPATQIMGGHGGMMPQMTGVPGATPLQMMPTQAGPLPTVIQPTGSQVAGTALQTTDRILPNAQLSSAIQAAERLKSEQAKQTEEKRSAGGERVIQPIHDPHVDDVRNEMQKRMAEILGDDADEGDPQAINTKTARKTAPAPMPAPTTEQAAAHVPNAGLPPEINQNPVEQAKNVTLAPDTNSQQDLVRNQIAAQPVAENAEPIESTTVAQAQAVQAQTQRTATEEQAEIEAATGGAPAQGADPNAINSNNMPEEVIEAIQPGYVTQLEDDLSEETQKAASSSMEARMADELKDDEITLGAQQKAEEAALEAARHPNKEEEEAANRSAEIEQALNATATATGPNITNAAPVNLVTPGTALAPGATEEQTTPAELNEPAVADPGIAQAVAPEPEPTPAPTPALVAPTQSIENMPRPTQGLPPGTVAAKPAPELAPQPIVRSTATEVSGNIPH